ncbi:PQQ-binding-like beta-propeller repeat protein [Streptomyces sp. NBC_00083]|uniref:outer membrane protein assembly factor BamB family protein n=1 Tax=Streptomyces sp. NBC_00083 TaxID=2975647 RepID=UPI0022536A16|nr:PQQ-binding-like beta-propeller repeat protein [Streptomyces sp. NBC_00083]MCX5384058.1 PQQ-like beta-propeller repeat protein [Streptomyces sp. NBC_00083]
MSARDSGELPDAQGHMGSFGPAGPQWSPAAPVTPGRRIGSRHPMRLVLAAVATGLVLVGGGVLFALDGGSGHGKPSAHSPATAPPSASPSVDQGDGKGTGEGGAAYDPNAGIAAGESPVWLRENETALTQQGAEQFGPWRAGDVVARAMYKEVTGYGAGDGKDRWKLTFDTPLCGVPHAPSAQNKLVVGLLASNIKGAHCTILQQIDLATGTAGWKTVRNEAPSGGSALTLTMAISGDTVAVAWNGGATGYSVADGHKLYDVARSDRCSPQAFAGGARLISAGYCFDAGDPHGRPGDLLQELDPATGKPRWSYQYDKEWRIGQVLSVDPLVVTALPTEGKSWQILAFTADGKLRSRSVPAFQTASVCSGYGQSLDQLQSCYGAVADAGTLYIAADGTGTDVTRDADGTQVVAVDLDTGKEKWRANPDPGRKVRPLAVEDGKVVVYLDAGPRLPAAVAVLAPAGGTPQVFLRSPVASADAERALYAPKPAWAQGRLFLLNKRVQTSRPDHRVHALLSFGR